MDDFFTPVSTTYTKRQGQAPGLFIEEDEKPTEKPAVSRRSKIDSADDALEVLKSQPDYDELISVLRFLVARPSSPDSFNVAKPTPSTASIVQVLITEIAPNYWQLLQEESSGKNVERRDSSLLTECLRSVVGINAIVLRLRSLVLDANAEGGRPKDSSNPLNLKISLEVLSEILDGDGRVLQIWRATSYGVEDARKWRPLWQELLSALTSGKITSYAAEAEDVAKVERRFWISDSSAYSQWLGRNVVYWAKNASTEDERKLCSGLYERSSRLNHYESLVKIVATELLHSVADGGAALDVLYQNLSPSEQTKFLYVVINLLNNEYIPDSTEPSTAVVSGVAGVVQRMVGSDAGRKRALVGWATGVTSSTAGFRHRIGTRRAVVAVLSQDAESIVSVVEKSFHQFGDQWNIKHMAEAQQDAVAQVLLLSAGYMQRKNPRKMASILRSSTWLSSMSNRIRAADRRAQMLGMVIGEALSGLSDASTTKLNFKMEETSTEEALWLKGLVNIDDHVGPFDALLARKLPASKPKSKAKKEEKKASQAPTIPRLPQQGFVIEEVDSDNSEVEKEDLSNIGLKPYAKPDSDPEDSDDDPTLIRRDKPKAPVYVRDLITYLRDTESYDRQRLALSTAPVLIRRKAGFGTEVSAHAVELAGLLAGLQDKFELEGFHDERVQAMLALAVSQPKEMGPWFARTFYEGDYSVAQRAAVLVVLGLAARELAGFDVSRHRDAALFPSKTLPEKVERLFLAADDDAAPPAARGLGGGGAANALLLTPGSPYLLATPDGQAGPRGRRGGGSALKPLPPNAIDSIAADLAGAFLAPLAAAGADEAAGGPDALKLASYKARLDAETKGKAPDGFASSGTVTRRSAALSKTPAAGDAGTAQANVTRSNTTAPMLAAAFFAPLASRAPYLLSSSSSGGLGSGALASPLLLPLLLKTLSIVLHASGPAAAPGGHLEAMTSALWGLVLSARGRAAVAHDGAASPLMRALVTAVATLLQVNEAAGHGSLRRLAETNPTQLVETGEWLAVVFHALEERGGGGPRGPGGGGRVGGGRGGAFGNAEQAELHALVAGTLFKVKETIEEYQRLLVGDLIGYG